ncbi:MAG: hypothetical protein HYT28_00600 [Parcubacteria group bacterium]|nr:hypothetical protein [Parcubacteria group bacterium]
MEQNEKKEFIAPYARYIWLALGALLLIVALSTSDGFRFRTDTSNMTKSITLVVDYGASERKWNGQFSDKVRVWDLLQQATALSKTDLVATGNFYPYKIDGHQNNTEWGWHYYLNGKLQTVPPFESFASNGDEVVFKWEAY